MRPIRWCVAAVLLSSCPFIHAEPPAFTRTRDVIYGHKYGTALTFDVFTPKQPNGAAVIFAVSGGWISAQEMINAEIYAEFLRHGYTVFAVVHGSQPKYSIPEIMEDMHRAVRFIRHNAGSYHIDANRIGISGGSAGGHLSLMIGMAGRPENPAAKDAIDRESSRVAAVACFFPPTDFLNYGEPGRDVFKALEAELGPFKAPFNFVEVDAKSGQIVPQLVPVTDPEKRRAIAREVSPITYVTPDDPPTFIIHGDADKLVPIQQSQAMEQALKVAGVPVKLVVKTGQGHGWADWMKDTGLMADWFDTHLKAKATSRPAEPEQK